MSRWFRCYDDLVDDPKVQQLPAETFKSLINLWCLTSQNNGSLPPIAHIAFKLRMKAEKVSKLLGMLRIAGLLEDEGSVTRPHNWNARQFKSDEKPASGKDSYVYFIGRNWGSTLKIGFSKNPWARVGELQTAQPDKIEVLAVFKCRSVSEVDLHDVLKEFRKNGEWFDLPTHIYVAIHNAADRKCSYDALVVELRCLLRSATTETETETEQIQKDPAASAAGADAPVDHRKRLFDEGLAKLARMTGKGPDACRSFVGKCLKASGDDAVTVLGLIDEAERNQAVDPSAWIASRLKPAENFNGTPKRGIIQAADDLCRKIASFDGPAKPDIVLRDAEGQAPPRLLPHG